MGLCQKHERVIALFGAMCLVNYCCFYHYTFYIPYKGHMLNSICMPHSGTAAYASTHHHSLKMSAIWMIREQYIFLIPVFQLSVLFFR